MQECDSSKLLQEFNGKVWGGWVGGSIVLWKALFQVQKKSRKAAASKAKGRVPWHNNVDSKNHLHGSYDWMFDNKQQLQSMVWWL